MKAKKSTAITIGVVTKQRLQALKLTKGESDENIIKRLIIKYGGLI